MKHNRPIAHRYAARRLAYYAKWLSCMDAEQLATTIGVWVAGRIEIYTGIVKTMAAEVVEENRIRA